MLEKFIGKSKAEKERNPERIAELGRTTLEREAVSEIEPRRSGGYMLCTVLAMALATGMTAGKAEAQTGDWANFGKQVASDAIFESGSAVDKAQNSKQDGIEHEYVDQLTRLGDEERQLGYQYSKQKNLLMRQGGSLQDLKKLESAYQEQRDRVTQKKMELKKEYERQTRNTRVKKAITGMIFQGARGW
jgi:hypothetical protein